MTVKAFTPLSVKTRVFRRPTNAVAFRGSATLFTIPYMDGLLFKEVSSIAELEDVGGGICHSTEDGVNVWVAAGKSANYPLSGRVPSRSSTPYTAVYGGGLQPDLGTVTTQEGFIPAELRDFWRPFCADNASGQTALETRYTTDSRVGYRTIEGGAFYQSPAFGGFEELNHTFALVSRAEYGCIWKKADGVVNGWLSTHVTLGTLENLLKDHVHGDMYNGADDKVKPYIIKAWNRLKAQNALSATPKIGIITTMDAGNWDRTRLNASPGTMRVEVGVGFVLPRVAPDVTRGYGGDEQLHVYYGYPCAETPHIRPTIMVGTPGNLPIELIRSVAAWQRMALCFDVAGVLKQPPIPVTAGSWEWLMQPYYWHENAKSALATLQAAGVPASATGLLNFNPSLGQDENVSPMVNAHFTGHVTGDLVISLNDTVRAIYDMAESIAREENS